MPLAVVNHIDTNPCINDQFTSESNYSIDATGSKASKVRGRLYAVPNITTFNEASSEGDEWIEKALRRIYDIAIMPDDWDGEGSPRPDLRIIRMIKIFLDRLRESKFGAVPVPFVCPVPVGGIQFEWTSSKKYLEIEFLDTSSIAFLKEEFSPQGRLIDEYGEYLVIDAEKTRQLINWFAAI